LLPFKVTGVDLVVNPGSHCGEDAAAPQVSVHTANFGYLQQQCQNDSVSVPVNNGRSSQKRAVAP